MAKKPAFNPNAPFEVPDEKPAFNPDLPYDAVDSDPEKKNGSSKPLSLGYKDAYQVPLESISSASKSGSTSVGIPTIEQATSKAAKNLSTSTYDMPAARVVDKSLSKVPPQGRVKTYDKYTQNIIAQVEPKIAQLEELSAKIEAGEGTEEDLSIAKELDASIQQGQKKLEIFGKGYEAIELAKSNLTEQEKADAKEKYAGVGGFIQEKYDAISAGAPAVMGMVAGALPLAVRLSRQMGGVLPQAAQDVVTEEIIQETGLGNLETAAQDLYKESNKISQAINAKYDAGIIDSFGKGDISGAANQASSKFLESFLPSVAAASTGGVGVLGFAGQEYYGELKDRAHMTEQQKLGLATLKGSLELAFESLGTKAVLSQVRKTLMKEGGEDLTAATYKTFIDKVLKDGFGKYTPLTAPVQEFISEYSTSLSQALADKAIDPEKEGLTFSEMNKQALEEGVIGAFGGEIIAAPTIPAMFKSSKGREAAQEISDKINSLDTELANNPSEEIADVLEDEKLKATQELNAEIEAENHIIQALPIEQQQELNGITEQINALQEQLPNVSPEVQPVIQTKIDELQAQSDNILANVQLTDIASPEPTGIEQTPTGTIETAVAESTGINEGSGVLPESMDTTIEVVGTESSTGNDTEGAGTEGKLKKELVNDAKLVIDTRGEIKEGIAPTGKKSILYDDLSKIYGKEEAIPEWDKINKETENPIVEKYVKDHGTLNIDYFKPDPGEEITEEANGDAVHVKFVLRDKGAQSMVNFFEDNSKSKQEKLILLNEGFKKGSGQKIKFKVPSAAFKNKEEQGEILQNVHDAEKLYTYMMLNRLNRMGLSDYMSKGDVSLSQDSAGDSTEDFKAAVDQLREEKKRGYLTDINGEPMIFMHAGGSGIERFRTPSDANAKKADKLTGQEGIYFSRDLDQLNRPGFENMEPGEGKDIYYSFLKIRNPYYVGDPISEAKYKLHGSETISTEYRKGLEAAGFDGVIWDKERSPKHEVIVFDPDQIQILATHEEGKKKQDESKITEPAILENPENLKQLPEPEKANLEKVSAETGVNFREIQNVYNKYGEGNPLSEITAKDYKKAQEKRDKSKEADKPKEAPKAGLTGLKKALVPEDKIEETDIERKSVKQVLETGKSMVEGGDIDPVSVIQEININPRALQPEEVAGLIYYKSTIDKQYEKNLDNINKYKESGDVQKEAIARAELAVLDKSIDAYHEMVLKTANEQSMAFRIRQYLVDSEFNLQSQIREYKKVNNGTIPFDVLEKFQEYDVQLKELNKKLEELQKKNEESEGQISVEEISESVDREYKKPKKKQILTDKEKARKKELVKKFLNRANDVTNIITLLGDKEFYEFAGLEFKEASGEFKEFARSMINTVGKGIREHLPDLYKKLGGKEDTEFEYNDIEIKNGKLKIPKDLIRDLVAAGYDKIESLTAEIYDRVKDTLPDVTERNVRDAITEYGKTANLSKEELDVKIRDLKRTGKLLSGLEDVNAKKAPLRSGLQRDKFTDEQRRLQKAIKEGLKDVPVSEEDTKKAWDTALDAVKSRLNNQISDLEKQIETGEKTPKREGIKYDKEALALQAKRDALKETIEKIEGKARISDEQRLRQSITGTEKTIAELERRIKENDFARPEKRTPVQSAELDKLKAKRDALTEQYVEMEKEAGIAEKRRIENYKKGLSRSIKEYEKRISKNDYSPRKKATKPQSDEESRELERKKLAIKEKYDIEIEKARLANRPLSEKIRDAYVDILGVPKSLMSTLDFSAPLRQGAVLSYSNPQIAAKAFVEMFKYFASESKFNKLIQDIKNTDKYSLIRDAKLYISEPNVRLSAKEEDFVSNIAQRIPVYGRVVKASERAYVGYLNKLRLDYFSKISGAMIKEGYDPNTDIKAFQDLASYINNATGRGNLGALEKSADLLNTAFFSPRYVASRLNILNPVNYAKMSPRVRKEALKSTLIYLAAWGVLQTLWAFSHSSNADDDDPVIEIDPRSSDFGKLRLGRTRYDVSAGLGPVIVYLARMLPFFGGVKRDGEVDKFGDEDTRQRRSTVTTRFVRSKASPFFGTLWDFADGETYAGEPVDRPSPLLQDITGKEVPYSQEALEKVLPLYISDFHQIAKEEGFGEAAIKMTPSIFGVGVQYQKE